MNTANRWLLFGALIAGLVHGRSPLQAQPAGEPAPTGEAPAESDDEVEAEDSNKPWSRGVSLEERKAARALFLEGNRLSRIPLYAKAVDQYLAALAKWKHPAFYFNMAIAQLNLGKEVEAHESLLQALAYGAAPLGPERFQEAQKQLQEVRQQIGQIRITCQTPGVEVTLDGATVFIGPGSYQGWVKARAHEITAKKAGYLTESRRLIVAADKLQEVELKLVTLGQATDASRRWAAWKPWAVVAAGGLIAAGGGGLHALSARNFSDYDAKVSSLPCASSSEMRPQVGCSSEDIGPALGAQLTRARRQQMIAVGSYIAGGAVVATGIVLLYMNRPRAAEQATPSTPTGGVAIAPVVSADMLGITLSVSH